MHILHNIYLGSFIHLYSSIQLEKLLSKNYYLHQSAKDGFRSYLQAYASYSLKKIFDVNALDLAKVGKAFGFAVPPRVNVNLGTGSSKPSNAPKNGRKRTRGEDEDDEDDIIMEEVTNAQEVDEAPEDQEDQEDQEEERGARNQVRREGKQRRIESLGHKKVSKEFYKKDKDRKRLGNKGEWSR